MYQRRLKIFLLFLLLFTIALMVRAAQMQVVDHSTWVAAAAELLKTAQITQTTRGRILDFTGKTVLAEDVPCTDACVDYRAIVNPPDPKWVSDIAAARLLKKFGSDIPADAKKTLTEQEIQAVQADIESMWSALAAMAPPAASSSGDPRAAIEQLRHDIVQQVQMERRWLWYRTFQINQTRDVNRPMWEKWLSGESDDGPDMDEFDITVDDAQSPHVILHAVDDATATLLGKQLEKFPGLVLLPSTHRAYPMSNVACHVLGRMALASEQDTARAKSLGWDDTRQYLANDLVGREGIEALCEPLLRRARGRIEKRVADGAVLEQKQFVSGQDVRITIDANLQAQVQEMLKRIRIWDAECKGPATPELSMHAAAVVIDVPSGEVRVLASNPDYDVNELESHYSELAGDRVDDPLRDRATCDAFVPGSTVKPIIGLGAITEGAIGPLQGIECTGYLELPVIGPDGRPTGRKIRQRVGRCWVASEFAQTLANIPPPFGPLLPVHHPIPLNAPHRGHDGNPDGWLTFADALERSCNIYFETVADRLGPAGVAYWYDQFGFGRRTGIGIEEQRGLRPGQRPLRPITARMDNCFAGIGQGQVWATPLQIANEAATIARNGVWMRPRLLTAESQQTLDAICPRSADDPPDRVDLHLDPRGLEQAHIGMTEVVNDPAGTGTVIKRNDMLVAGKTGSAQGAQLWTVVSGPDGRRQRQPRTPANLDPNSSTPWYRASGDKSDQIVHAWFMGYAPANNPQIAFCVLVEYAGAGGGPAAGPVVKQLLDACIAHGYLHPQGGGIPLAAADR